MSEQLIHATQGAAVAAILLYLLDGAYLILRDKQREWELRTHKSNKIKDK